VKRHFLHISQNRPVKKPSENLDSTKDVDFFLDVLGMFRYVFKIEEQLEFFDNHILNKKVVAGKCTERSGHKEVPKSRAYRGVRKHESGERSLLQ